MRVLWLCLLIISNNLIGQQRCGVDQSYFQHHQESINSFEKWLSEKSRLRLFGIEKEQQVIYQIPVVFHVIHAGEPLGEGSNIPDSRLLQQLEILNDDFRKLNADTVLTPDEFKSVAADIEVEFILAKRDPEGLPTSGIIRKKGSRNSYNLDNDDVTLKAESYWPAEHYLNFYVAELSGFIGWAQFPFSNLEGVEDIEPNRLTDGIAVDFEYVGINENTGGSFESFGRTGTHEIGHYLGLRHPWGDVFGCGGSDYCEDTPTQSDDYSGSCPSTEQVTCSTSDMYSNFMNYTDDACMNLFTFDQKERMRLILQHAPRRVSLTTSPALLEPIQVSNDLGIRDIISPSLSSCQNQFTPIIQVRNYGTNTIQSFEISMFLNDNLVETVQKDVVLSNLETAIINFADVTELSGQLNEFSFRVESVNDMVDNNNENDRIEITIPMSETELLPFIENFEGQTATNARTFSGRPSLWSITQAPYQTVENTAISVDLSDPAYFGEFDFLLSPVFDFTSLNSVELGFSYSYRGDSDPWNKDGLIVAISTDCGENFFTNNYLFEGYGSQLVTTNSPSNPYVPANPNDWERESINITSYTGLENIRIAFIGINNGGGRLYIDSVELISNQLSAYDIGIRSFQNFPVVTCNSFLNPVMEVKNFGFEEISSFDINYSFSNQNVNIPQSDLQLTSGETDAFQFPINNLPPGNYTFSFEVNNPNDLNDEIPDNNVISRSLVIDNSEESLPIRQNFENESNWITISPTSETLWSFESVDGNTTLKANAFENPELGNTHWLVTPILEPEESDSLGLFFSYAYKSRLGASDRLQIFLSITCGDDFQFLVYDKSSSELNLDVENGDFIPGPNDWIQEFVDLSEYTLWDEIRIAWVFTNGNGNNLYLDDIEFVNNANPNYLDFIGDLTVFPNPAIGQSFNITLDLARKENVTISVVDMTGKVVFERDYPNALNQTLNLITPNQSGFYIVRVIGPNVNESRRVFIRR